MKALLGTMTDGAALKIDIPRLIESKLLITAMSGGGKSFKIRGLLERTHGQIQQIVVDIDGEFASLREKFDYILVGPGGDLPADVRSAELLATKLLELGADTIIDLSEMRLPQQAEFVRLFISSLMNAPKKLWHPVMILIDEAQRLAPQDGSNVTAAVAEEIGDLARRGRKREFTLVAAIQRLSEFDKGVAAQCQNKLIGLTTLDTDVKRAAADLGMSLKEASEQLRTLDPGDFYAFGPAISRTVVKFHAADVKTKHGKAARKAAARAAAPTGKVKQVLAKLADLPKEAEEDLRDRDAMKSKIRELEKQLKEKAGLTPAEKAQLVQQAYEKGKSEVLRTMSQLKNQFKARLQNVVSQIQDLGALVERIPDGAAASSPGPTPQRRDLTTSFVHTNSRPTTAPPAPRAIQAPAAHVGAPDPAAGDVKFGLCERRILGFLIMKAGEVVSRVQVGAMTGYAHGSGSFNTALSKLSTAGLISRNGGDVTLTPGAEQLARDIAGNEVPHRLEDWIAKLGKCERSVYERVLKEPSTTWTRDELGRLTGYAGASGSFNTALSHLSTLGLIKRHPEGRIGLNPEIAGLA